MKNKLTNNDYQDILSTEDCVITATENYMNEQIEQEEQAVEAVTNLSPLKQAMLAKKAKKKARKTLEKQGFDKKAATKLVKQAVNRIAAKPIRRASGRGG